jgi:hypothetical protein
MNIQQKIEKFYQENQRYPLARDFDNTAYLPSARTIQRKYGGLVALKKDMGLTETDARTGTQRVDKAKAINERNNKIEAQFTKDLKNKMDVRNIHHPYAPFDDSKINIDYLLFHPTEKKAVGLELFYPEDRHSFYGCLNIKQHKRQCLDQLHGHDTKFYYVVTNRNITPKQVWQWSSNRKSDLNADGVIHMKEVLRILTNHGII